MLLRVFFCLLFIGFTSAYLTVDGCGTSIYQRPRIIGGKPAKRFAYPWMVFLQIDKRRPDGRLNNCGGAILNHRWIVTAAHCVNVTRMETSKAYVNLQYLTESYDKYVQQLGISAIAIHPNYNNLNAYDIALIRTTEPINIEGSEGYVNGICLPETNSPYPTGKASVIGFGCTDYNKPTVPSNVLQETVVPIFPTGTCAKRYGEIYRDMICAGGEETSACFGDSGGPLFQTHNGVSYLIGIVSGGENNWPIRYTNVASFLGWMRNEMT